MLNPTQIRSLYAAHGPVGFVRAISQSLGLRKEMTINGKPASVRSRDPRQGTPTLESTRAMRPEQFSLKQLAIGLMGEYAWEAKLREPAPQISALHGDVLEAGNDIVPSQFADITAYNETVAGLLEAKMLEGYQRPEYLHPQLFQNYPADTVYLKLIGISTPADSAQPRQPGQPHPRAELTQRYVETPVAQNISNAVDVTFEAVRFDRTQQLLDHAEQVGGTLSLRKEYRCLDVLLGIVNTYKYNGTNYYTYVVSGGNWVNLVRSNPFVDWTSLDTNYRLFALMTDQETSEPISVDARQILCMPANRARVSKAITDSQVAMRTQSLAVVGYGDNPVRTEWDAPLVSQYAYKRARDADGLNLDATATMGATSTNGTADNLWFTGNFKKAFGYVENIPLKIERAAPSSYEMLDRGLIFSLFADEMGVPFVREPRYVIANTDATSASYPAKWQA